MIYGKDEPMLFPVADLYDSGMMKELITAAREQYNQNREDMKDFIKTYGDFMSPFSADIDWVDRETRGRINDAMNYLQQNGIDPLRSAEGRAIIQNVINSVDRAGINRRRANAEAGEEYLKARGQLIANGKYNNEYENWLLNQLGLPDFEHFDSTKGTWTRTSPASYEDLNARTSPWFDKLTPGYLYTKDGYDYVGLKDEDLQAVLSQQMPDFMSSDYGKFQYELAKRQLQQAGIENPSASDIMNQLSNNIVSANRELTARPTRSMNEGYKMKVEHGYKIAEQNNQAANQRANNRDSAYWDWFYKNSVPDENGKPKLVVGGGNEEVDSSEYSHVISQMIGGAASVARTKQNPSGLKINDIINGDGTIQFVKTQRDLLKSIKNGMPSDQRKNNEITGKQIEEYVKKRSSTDSAQTLNAQLFGNFKEQDGYYLISGAMQDRLYSGEYLLRNADGGFFWKNEDGKLKSGNRRPNTTNYAYRGRATGNIIHSYERDGRLHTYVEIDTYYQKKGATNWEPGDRYYYDTHMTSVKNNYKNRTTEWVDKKDHSRGANVFVGGQYVGTVPTHLGQDGRYYLPNGFSEMVRPFEVYDFSIDPQYIDEIKSSDAFAGKEFGDKATNEKPDKNNYGQ